MGDCSSTGVRSGRARKRPWIDRRRVRTALLATLAFAVIGIPVQGASSADFSPCDGLNEIACENSKPGTPASEWQVTGDGDLSIQGFATDISVDQGTTQHFKIKTDATAYRVDIYRTGWYGGRGARLIESVTPSATLPQTQPECVNDAATGLVDCGNWSVSASWQVPADAVSGVYLARLVRTDTGGASHIVFVVRDDDGGSDLLFQTSDTTWNAYNAYGGVSLYRSTVDWYTGRGKKVSYNRPLTIRATTTARSGYFGAEYPMVRWLERNGYDVSYFTGMDTARAGAEIRDHRAFLSVGHDEYWSAEQRANVEAARDAGVNLAFFSGNEIFWKTRWESSIDGASTPFRTLVSYKETYFSSRTDPSGVWTGTWRDKRFSPPADGGRPENALTGTLYMVNSYRNDPMSVRAEDGRLRFWRNTDIATLPLGSTATLPAGVLGYEWDEDADNGHRPSGSIKLSSTTIAVHDYLVDAGTTYAPRNATHSLTLYRAASGALVFGAGTIQWSWGLDDEHDFPGTPEDRRMQQATLNLFADMGAQPTTMQSVLVAATRSTDTVAPTATITSPTAGTAFPRGQSITITGTASDSGGGVVGGVEVSVDDGQTWHPAAGRENWSYTWAATGYGATTVRARASDDSANLGGEISVVVEVGGCPCSVWNDSVTPETTSYPDGTAYELGMRFRADVDGFVTAVRFYKGAGNTGTHTGHLWTNDGTQLAEAIFTEETESGWQQAYFPQPIPVSANTTYVISYYTPTGRYALNRPYFSSTVNSAPLRALGDGVDGGNGVYTPRASAFPINTKLSSNYWVDLVFETSATDRQAPRVTTTRPLNGATGVALGSTVTAKFTEPVDAATVSDQTFELRDTAGARIDATVTYDEATQTAALDPAGELETGATYTAIIRGGANGVRDTAGNTFGADYSWSFTTFSCPCSLWPTTTPATPAYNDTAPYELGFKFRSDMNGYVTGIRFYKGAGNTGTHKGHLWASTGEMLGEVVFTNETETGWQTATFAGPIPITAGTTYVASYYAPNGRYALNRPYFTTGFRHGPLEALRDGVDGPNGVFKSGGTIAFPTQSKLQSNYWADVVFELEPVDAIAPSVVSTKPAADATSVGLWTNVSAKVDEALDPASVTPLSVELRTAAGSPLDAAVTYDATAKSIVIDPTEPLAVGATYTAVVRGGGAGVRDLAGNPLPADHMWSFSTFSCPCSLWPTTTPATAAYSDFSAYELGFKFRSDLPGRITGIRFYKGTGNGGRHVGHLWTRTGTLLGEVVFTNESATGWQTATFETPIPIEADTTYVASYFAPQGRYSLNRPYFTSGYDSGPLHALADGVDGPNGLFKSGGTSGFPTQHKLQSNYWVDVVFEP